MTLVNRWYQILQYFIAYDRLTREELQKITATTSQTVKKTIQLLNEQLDHIAKIIEKEGFYQLKVIDTQQFEAVMNGSLKQHVDLNSSSKRIAVLIDCFIKQNDYIVIDDLSDLLGVSRSTVNKDLRSLKQLLAEYDSTLIGTPNKGLLLKGQEENLRMLYLYHAYDYLEYTPLNGSVLQLIEELSLTKKLDFRMVGLLKKVITFTMKRIHSGNSLSMKIPYYVNYFAADPQLEMLMIALEENYSLTISQYDFDFLCFPLNIFNNNAVDDCFSGEMQAAELFRGMMETIRESVILTLDEQKLFSQLKLHFMFLINRIIFRVQAYDLFGHDFRNKLAFAYELADLGIQALSNFLVKPKQEAEIAYLAVYFELALKNESDDEDFKEIAIICNTGKGTALMIKRQLRNVLGPNIQIVHYSEEAYKTEELNCYFAIFTTIPLEETKVPTIMIKLTDLFNDSWLLGEWKRIIASKAASFKNIQFNFELLAVEKSYEENLTVMLERLTAEKLVDEKFAAYILQKAQEDSAVIENGIAFPHGINNQSDQIIVSIGSYREKVSLEEVELIFLVAIPVNLTIDAEDELLSFYDTIFLISSNPTLRKQVREITSEKDYTCLLTKGER
ncbi:HTH domain-containing protein [Enterococcus sp. BWT-B8]|uniref:BglG family transcription antiterminator n=1 Tax=Enterococcus sp. BWT-B8 TaxID=2885157 RepID=UPI001E44A250|nr:HTH domain-containing protein [Enterococcus sp. BWT-B8]MCB5952837.1 HTH domain-containing protein [Enterococcus sp. BWT-B8]